MAGSEPAIDGKRARAFRNRLRVTLYLFGSLLAISHIVSDFNINAPEGWNINLVYLLSWPPLLIAFSGALWLFLTTSGNGSRIWAPIAIISFCGACLFMVFFQLVPYNGHAEWGTFQGLLPSITLLSIAGVSVSWRLLDPRKSGDRGWQLHFGYVSLLLILTFVAASLAFFYLIEFIPLTVASAAIWGWVYDPLRLEHSTVRMRSFSRILAFLATFIMIPILVLMLPYYMFWFYFT